MTLFPTATVPRFRRGTPRGCKTIGRTHANRSKGRAYKFATWRDPDHVHLQHPVGTFRCRPESPVVINRAALHRQTLGNKIRERTTIWALKNRPRILARDPPAPETLATVKSHFV